MLISNPFMRRRLAFDIKQYYFEDLEFALPLGYDLKCPVSFPDAGWSFKEIFLDAEYGPALDSMPLPKRWIDLGCHAGYFSLWLVWKRRMNCADDQFEALLVDADGRLQEPIKRLIELNNLQNKLQFAQGLISNAQGQGSFFVRDVMASSAVAGDGPGTSTEVPVLKAADIQRLMPPPYDLIKVDIEGAEFDLLQSYRELLGQTGYLLLEWHSWQQGGGGEEQIVAMAEDAGFVLDKKLCDARPVGDAQNRFTGTHLYKRKP